jgi:hypothetical protein
MTSYKQDVQRAFGLYTAPVMEYGDVRELKRALKDIIFHILRLLFLLVLGFTGPISLPVIVGLLRRKNRKILAAREACKQVMEYDL